MTKNVRLLRNICFEATALTILVLMAATFIENIFGTDFVSSHIYSSPLFVTLWALVTVSSLLYLIARKMTKRKTVFLLHLSFVVILAGAFTTHIDGIQGYIHLRQGDEPSYIYRTRHGSEGLLPFGIALDDFRLAYYHGTLAPMDFIGSLTIYDDNAVYHGETSMNRIYSYHNYRFNPSTYDSDGKGCTLQLSYDPYGIAITYTGYAILLLAMLLFFFDSHSSFRGLLRHPALRKFTVCAALAAAPYIPAHADGLPPTLPPNIAEKMGNLYIYYNDRVCPLQTLARDFTTKLYGKPSYRGMSAEQVLLGWFFYYNEWKEEPMIRIKSKEVRQMLDMQGKYTSLAGFFDNEGYKLTSAQQEETKAHDLRGIREADEQANLASMAGSGYIFKIFPYRENDSIPPVWLSVSDRLPASMPYEQWLFIRYCMNYMAEHVAKGDFATVDSLIAKTLKYQEKEAHGFLPSDTRFRAEKLYNAMASTSFVAIGCLIIGMAAFAFYCRYFSHGKHKKPSWANRLLVTLMLIALLYILAVMVLRGIVGGHFPASNGFETMHLMAACSLILSMTFHRRFDMLLPFGFLLCGFALLVAMLGEANPPITQLMPVLSSPLLSIHVATIMMAYALFAFAMFNGATAIIIHGTHPSNDESIERLYILSRIMLYPAIFLLATGIFIGAVWANVSWGRYWGWDPKEVWALITLLVYSAALHTTSLPALQRHMFFHRFTVIAFLCVLVTYLGVNFFLGGLHSYA